MPLGETLAAPIKHQRAVIPRRRLLSQRAIEEDLPRSRAQQVCAAYHFGNAHRNIINHDSKLVSRNIVPPPDKKITKITPGDVTFPPRMAVLKRDDLAVR